MRWQKHAKRILFLDFHDSCVRGFGIFRRNRNNSISWGGFLKMIRLEGVWLPACIIIVWDSSVIWRGWCQRSILWCRLVLCQILDSSVIRSFELFRCFWSDIWYYVDNGPGLSRAGSWPFMYRRIPFYRSGCGRAWHFIGFITWTGNESVFWGVE